MIDCLIFSKDRACQLDLLLRSIKDNFKELQNIKILYLPTNESFNDGYSKIQQMYPEYEWIREQNFVNDTLGIFYSFKNEFVLNFVDDEIIIRDFPIEPALNFLRSSETHCVSMRMAPHINFCYTANRPDPQPEFLELDFNGTKMFRWDWRTRPNNVNWGYPSCINSHIYKTEEFVQNVSMVNFQYPNALEGNFNLIRERFNKFNACFEKSKSVNIANNLIQTGPNRHGSIAEWQVDNLNREFLNGRRLSTKPFYGFENTLATFEKEYEWEN